MKEAKEILRGIIEYGDHVLTYSEAKEVLKEIDEKLSVDFYIQCDGNEYRIISESEIWDIYVETIKELVNDCYDLKLEKVPDWISLEIDWEQTSKNAYVDGYGHTFSSYDGGEIFTGDYWIFRVN